uniref:CCHC-type domain-containing protein n=1 Tax=Cannabis sativa TaxID=3483 RepID=A0A803Q962_CANSA
MVKRAKMVGKGKLKGKKTGPSSSDRVIKIRSIDAVLGIQELEVEEADDSMEQCHHSIEQYEKVFSPEESEELSIRQSEIHQDFSDWLTVANRATQDVNSGKRISPPILRSSIVRNLETSFEQLKNDTGKEGTKKKVKIEFANIEDEVNFLQPSVVYYVIGANPPISILEGFVRRIWKDEVVKVGLLAKGIFIIRFQSLEQRDIVLQQGYVFFDRKPMVMKPWNPIDDFTKEEVTNVPTWVQLKGLVIKYWGEASLFKIAGQLVPLQIDNLTKNRDRLQYPRILIQVSLAQKIPEKNSFIDEFDHEVDLDVKYEWLPLVCYNCSGIGHRTSDCRKKEEKKEVGKKVWVPKKPAMNVEKQLDDEGFQKVSKGKKVVSMKEAEGTMIKNMFESLNDDVDVVVGTEIDGGIAEQETGHNTRGEGDPSSSNG